MIAHDLCCRQPSLFGVFANQLMEEMAMFLNCADAPAEVSFSYRRLRMKLLNIVGATLFLNYVIYLEPSALYCTRPMQLG